VRESAAGGAIPLHLRTASGIKQKGGYNMHAGHDKRKKTSTKAGPVKKGLRREKNTPAGMGNQTLRSPTKD